MEIGIDPVAFSIFSRDIYWYGIMVALAVLVGVAVPLKMARKWGIVPIPQDQLFWVAVIGVVGGVIGARLIHVLDEWSYFMDQPGEIIGGEGMGIYGAILGGTLFAVVYARYRGFGIGRLCDVGAFGLILAQIIGRVGCTLNGCCYGTPTDLPWGTTWTHPDSHGPSGVAVHPTQVYEMLWDMAILGLIWSLRRRVNRPGAIYLIYITVYSVGRFFISFLRENKEVLLGLQQPQIVSLVVAIVAVGLLVYVFRKPPGQPSGPPEPVIDAPE